MTVMVLGGLWHGAAWTFILWGAWHGLFLALERRRRGALEAEGHRPAAVAATMVVVIFGWVLFRSASLKEALAMASGMIGLHGFALSSAFRWQLGGLELAVLALAFAAVYVGPWLARRAASWASWQPALAGRLAAIPLFLLALLRSTAVSFTPFLYFRF